MGNVAPMGGIPGLEAEVASGAIQIEWSGKWKNPPGWSGRQMWDGNVTKYSGAPGRKREIELPNLYFVERAAEYQKNLEQGWKDASQLPAVLKDNILDFYGHDLTEAQQVLCADRIALREAERAVTKKAAVRPAPRSAQPRRVTTARAAAAPSRAKPRRTKR
jgi:hypothetical protein